MCTCRLETQALSCNGEARRCQHRRNHRILRYVRTYVRTQVPLVHVCTYTCTYHGTYVRTVHVYVPWYAASREPKCTKYVRTHRPYQVWYTYTSGTRVRTRVPTWYHRTMVVSFGTCTTLPWYHLAPWYTVPLVHSVCSQPRTKVYQICTRVRTSTNMAIPGMVHVYQWY
jgi:hypothetical protein